MMWCEALSSGGVDLPKLASTNRSSQNPSRTVAFYIINHSDSESVNASAGSFHFPVVFGPVFGRSWRIFATNRHFQGGFRTNRAVAVRNSESTCFNRLYSVQYGSGSQPRSCYKGMVFVETLHFGGIPNFSFWSIRAVSWHLE